MLPRYELFMYCLCNMVCLLCLSGGIDDPLEDEGSLKEQMERLPVIARLQYDTVAQYLLTMFEQSLTMYEQGISMAATSQILTQIQVLEGRMTWLTYMVASVIDAQATNDPRKGQSELLWDGRLSRCVFQLIQIIDFRLNSTSGQGKCDTKLEVAILNYFKSFKKIYLVESASSTPSMGLFQSNTVVPGGSPAHPLLSLALSYSGSARAEEKDGSAEIVSVSDSLYHVQIVRCILLNYNPIYIGL